MEQIGGGGEKEGRCTPEVRVRLYVHDTPEAAVQGSHATPGRRQGETSSC
jgi:hypothetical protein